MTEKDAFGLLKVHISERVNDEATLYKLGAHLGVKDWEIKGIKYNKDKDGNYSRFKMT